MAGFAIAALAGDEPGTGKSTGECGANQAWRILDSRLGGGVEHDIECAEGGGACGRVAQEY